MPMMNRMTDLLDLIERRLGTRQLNLPKSLGKDVWAEEVIEKDTLRTFSRFYPASIDYVLTSDRKKGPYYLIDEKLCNSVEILGCGDIDWKMLSKSAPAWGWGGPGAYFSMFDFFNNVLDMDSIAGLQMLNDHVSMLKTSLYVEFRPPNCVEISSVLTNNMIQYLKAIPLKLYICHSKNLMTIEPTKMETFEQLALCDVAIFLYNNLKYYQNVETVFATTDMNLDVLQDYQSRRDDIVTTLRDSYVSAGNRNQPILIAI